MDLAISNTMYTSRHGPHLINPYDQRSIDEAFEQWFLPYELAPREAALLATELVISVPYTSVGLIGVRSTWARLGVVSPLTIVDPGFEGILTLEIFNASGNFIKVSPGDEIFSLTLVPAETGTKPYSGRYQGQSLLTLAKALERK